MLLSEYISQTEHLKVKNGSFNIVDVYNIEITEIFSLETFLKCIKTSLTYETVVKKIVLCI